MKEGIFLMSILWLWGTAYHKAGEQEGRLQVTKGEYSCELKTQEDKTTEWECLKNETRR